MSESRGGRPSASKIAIVIVSGRSEDTVEAAALSARMNSKSHFTVTIFKQIYCFLRNSLEERNVKLRCWYGYISSGLTVHSVLVRNKPEQNVPDEDDFELLVNSRPICNIR